jgi:hypothetical protein
MQSMQPFSHKSNKKYGKGHKQTHFWCCRVCVCVVVVGARGDRLSWWVGEETGDTPKYVCGAQQAEYWYQVCLASKTIFLTFAY